MKPAGVLVWVLVGLLTQAATITITNETLPKAPPRPGQTAAPAPDAAASSWVGTINRLRSAKRLAPVALDPVVSDGARRQAEMISRLPAAQLKNLPSRLLLEKLWEAGTFDGNPTWRVLSQDSDTGQGPGAGFQLGTGLEGDISHIGVGSIVRNGVRWTVISAVKRRVTLSGYHLGTYKPFERLWLRGRAMPGFENPRLVLTRPNGKVSEIPLALVGDHFEYLLELDEAKGRYMLEIMIDSRWGPSVASLFPVDVGGAYQAPPIAASDDQRLSLPELRERMLTLINADRKRFNLPPVRLNDRLTVMAQGHSEDMKQHGFFAHVSPQTGDLGDRAKAANIAPSMALGENIAVAGSLSEAEEGLMASPAHRGMILDAQMTVVGLGITSAGAKGRESAKYWITQNYGEHAPE